MEDKRHWYEAEVLFADLTGHRHTMRGACVEEIETRMRLLFPRAAIILVCLEEGGSEASSRALDPRRKGNGSKG